MAVKARIRFDYKAEPGSRRWWRRVDLPQLAKEKRSKQISLLRSLPFQGLNVEAIDPDHEIYLLPEDENHQEIAFAPLELVVQADTIEDLMPLTMREEFRKIKIIEPPELRLSNGEIERVLFRMNTEYRDGLD